jgi:hypothetical protein
MLGLVCFNPLGALGTPPTVTTIVAAIVESTLRVVPLIMAPPIRTWAKSEWITEVHGITSRESELCKPSRQPDRVLLGEATRCDE